MMSLEKMLQKNNFKSIENSMLDKSMFRKFSAIYKLITADNLITKSDLEELELSINMTEEEFKDIATEVLSNINSYFESKYPELNDNDESDKHERSMMNNEFC
ncbi:MULTISPECIES: hypothetical protein [unclassified Colwellia]|jgi:hypothetical protein|uniref:hypothetical protein n=1 Tax=unclassified Colwellia TaxID=196834 RepID=UPI0015F50120|nr:MULTISPECIES: hypothetical protein [unclassified Colwellia]MBA6251971.1 hypothetical protein [Colwellia sp. MB3u-55]MBA6396928.1 hypothetical protein [Colwellia sp. BRX10-4]